MKCSKCGTKLSEDTKFCSYCGNKIEASPKQASFGKNDVPQMPLDELVRVPQEQTKAPKSLANKIKENGFAKWSKLSIYGKIVTVVLVIFALLFIIALISGRTASAVISVIQIALAVVSILIHKDIIKLAQKNLWLKWLMLVITVPLTILNITSYSWKYESPDRPTADPVPDTSITAVPVTVPYGADECVGQDYSTIQDSFRSAGSINVKVEKIEDLKVTDPDKVNTIDSISIGGNPDFTKGQEFKTDDEVIIRYHAYEKCNVTIHVDFVSNLIFSKYDLNLLLNGIEKGTLTHGEEQDFELYVDPGEYTLTFESDEASSVKGEVVLTVDCDIEASYKISCYNDNVSIETLYVDRLTELADGEVKLDVAASEYKYKNYEEVSTALKTLGFTNIRYEILYDIALGWTDEGEVESVSIADKTDFNRGNVFPADAKIVITYHMPEDDDPNKPIESKPTESDDSGLSHQGLDGSEPNLTAENCPELAEMLTNKAEIDETYSSFATKYQDRIIEFDGRIDYCTKHGNYNTRFDYLVSAGDYDPDHQIGPTFKFEDVNYYDLNTDLDTVSVGLNVHIVAIVRSFDSNNGLFYLDPVSVTGR